MKPTSSRISDEIEEIPSLSLVQENIDRNNYVSFEEHEKVIHNYENLIEMIKGKNKSAIEQYKTITAISCVVGAILLFGRTIQGK